MFDFVTLRVGRSCSEDQVHHRNSVAYVCMYIYLRIVTVTIFRQKCLSVDNPYMRMTWWSISCDHACVWCGAVMGTPSAP